MKADLKKYNAVTITSIHMDYDDFDQLVEDHYGVNPEFVASFEADNGGSYTFEYSNYPEKDSYDFVGEDKAQVQAQIRQGDYPDYRLGKIFATLIDDGIIDPAHYTINVNW